MAERALSIVVAGSGSVSAVRTPSKDANWTFIYAPGAGSNLHDPFGAFAARTLAALGVTTVRFQFPYMEAGRKSPDRPPVLEATWRAVIASARDAKTRLVVGGRSMGGRIGSMVVAEDGSADALAMFAYPLHPPGKPEQRRVGHLPSIKVPTLFVSGTNDAFGSPNEITAAAKQVKRSKVHLLDGADHGFAVRKSTGRTKEDVWAEAVDVFAAWLTAMR